MMLLKYILILLFVGNYTVIYFYPDTKNVLVLVSVFSGIRINIKFQYPSSENRTDTKRISYKVSILVSY